MGLTLLHHSSGGLVSWLQWLPASWPAGQCLGPRCWVLSSVSQHLCGDACWTRETAAREAVESSSCPSPLPAGTPGNTGRGSCPMSPRGKGAQHLWPCISQRRRSLTLT